MANEKSQTVTFNVGGKVYEVSTSLLQSFPDTVLAKKVSATSRPIFIDRDPDRFAYCLDYMRDNGRVFLADDVSKDSFLQELKYFGFDNVDDSLIQYDDTSKRQTAARFQTNVRQSLRELENMRKEIGSLQQKVRMGELALHCLRESTRRVGTGEMSFAVGLKGGPFEGLSCLSDEAYFSECCERYGLQYIEFLRGNYNYNSVRLKFVGS